MTTRYPISVFIIAQNEADRIGLTIRSVVDWVDEVHVIDSGSTDGTIEISQKLGANAVFNPWNGYGPQKIFGESLCRNHWLLNLDADEEVTPELREQIQALFRDGKEPPFKAYSMACRLMHFIEEAGTYGMVVHPVRLYDKRVAGFKDSLVHDSVEWKVDPVPSGIGALSGALNHRSFRSYTHMIDKVNSYSTMQAQDMFNRGRRPSSLRIIIEPFHAFFKAWLVRRYITRGLTGYVESVMYAFARMLRLAKVRALYIEAERKQKNRP